MFFSVLKNWLFFAVGRKHNASALITGTIVACVVVAAMALKSTGMTDLSFSAFSAAGDVTVAQEYALNKAEYVRALNYNSVASVPVQAISNSNGFYEEVDVSDNEISTSVSGGLHTCPSKHVEVKIYKGIGEDRKLCTTLSLNRVDPVAFDDEINMVTNDSSSDSLYKAMSADAFRDLVDNKITNDKNSESDNVSLSAKALKDYLKDKLLDYSKVSKSAWFDGTVVGGNYRGIYVKADGQTSVGDVIYRGNVTNNAHSLIIVPTRDSNNIWHYDYVDRSKLYDRFIDQLYFTFTIKQTPHQTITVTTGDGIKHTETFSIKYGQTWTAELVPDTGYLAGTLSMTEGTALSNIEVSATDAVDMRTLLKIEKYGPIRNSWWAGEVYGQGNTTAAYREAWKLLDNYESTKDKWVECVSGGYHGNGISYKRTYYNAFRITYPWEYPGMQINVKWTILDGGNGTVTSDTIKEVSQWHKELVIAGHGGDKGHYGCGKISVDMTAPGLEPYHFEDTYWINSD